jgi:hypothetical protein
MLRTISRVVAICNHCRTTASDRDARILEFPDEHTALAVVTSGTGPDGHGKWKVDPADGLLCPPCGGVRLCAAIGHSWSPERPCTCVTGYLSGGCPEQSQICRSCRIVRTTHQSDGGVR